jgi:hypothetical protein
MVFLGTRPYEGRTVLARETFLAPVQWTGDGWPVVNGTHHVSLEMPVPKLKPFKAAKPKTKTAFTIKQLGPEWLYVRNADPSNFSLTDRPGYLRLKAAKDTLGNKEETPAFVGQRQPDFKVRARTSVEFNPTQEGEEAGLCVRANENNHYEIGIGFIGGKAQVFLRNTAKGQGYILASRPLKKGKVQLEILSSESQYQFAWSEDGGAWKTIGASPASDLSREWDMAGGFTGAVIGLYATSNRKESAAYADFAWFEMKPGIAPKPMALTLRPTPTPVTPSDTWRVKAGGGPFTDHLGRVWAMDEAFTGGDTAVAGKPIQAPQDPGLYTSERWGADFSYRFPVPPGKYRVTLRFAEAYVKKNGERVFSVQINGKKALEHFDILKEAGAIYTGIDKTFKDIQPGADGLIQIRFIAEAQNAKVCAIEIAKED